MSEPVTQLRNIGPRCAEWLAAIHVHTADDLRRLGAATAYRELVQRDIVSPHRMILYALGGAVGDLDCTRLPSVLKQTLEEEASIHHSPGNQRLF